MAKESGHLFFKKITEYSIFEVNKENKARVAMECGSWGFKCGSISGSVAGLRLLPIESSAGCMVSGRIPGTFVPITGRSDESCSLYLNCGNSIHYTPCGLEFPCVLNRDGLKGHSQVITLGCECIDFL